MNAKCTDPAIANPIPNPRFVTFTHPPVAALCFNLGKTERNATTRLIKEEHERIVYFGAGLFLADSVCL